MEELERLHFEALENLGILHPYVELKFHQFELQNQAIQMHDIYKAIENIAETQDPNFEEEFDKVFQYKELQQRKFELSKRLSDEYLDNYPEYQSRVKLLKELKYIDDDDRGKKLSN